MSRSKISYGLNFNVDIIQIAVFFRENRKGYGRSLIGVCRKVERDFVIGYRCVFFGRALTDFDGFAQIVRRKRKVYFGILFCRRVNNARSYGSLRRLDNLNGSGGFAAVEIRLRADGDRSAFSLVGYAYRIAVYRNSDGRIVRRQPRVFMA